MASLDKPVAKSPAGMAFSRFVDRSRDLCPGPLLKCRGIGQEVYGRLVHRLSSNLAIMPHLEVVIREC
jgi:hypothetical protein